MLTMNNRSYAPLLDSIIKDLPLVLQSYQQLRLGHSNSSQTTPDYTPRLARITGQLLLVQTAYVALQQSDKELRVQARLAGQQLLAMSQDLEATRMKALSDASLWEDERCRWVLLSGQQELERVALVGEVDRVANISKNRRDHSSSTPETDNED